MSKDNQGPQVHGLDASEVRTTSLADLLSVSSEEKQAAAVAATEVPAAADRESHAAALDAIAPDVDEGAAEHVYLDGPPPVMSPPVAAGLKPKSSVQQAPAPVQAMPEQPRAARSAHFALQMAGLFFTAVGGLLVVAPHASSAAGQWLANHGELRSQSGTLLISGLCMLTAGILLGALRDMRRTLVQVCAETERIESVVSGEKRVFETLDQVRLEHMVLSREVVHLQTKLRRLIEIVSNPDYTASIYRLASSVDQLGKEVDSSMKGRFDGLHQQLDTLGAQAMLAEKHLLENAGRTATQMKEQHDAQQLALKSGLDRLREDAADAQAYFDQNQVATARIEAMLDSQQQAAAVGFANMLDSARSAAHELGTGINGLRGHVDRLVGEHTKSMRAEFAQLDNRLEIAERGQTEGLGRLSEQVKSQFTQQADELHRGMGVLAGLDEDHTRLVMQELGGIAQWLEQQSQIQTECVSEAKEQTLAATVSAKNQIATLLEELTARIEAEKQEQQLRQQELQATDLDNAQATRQAILESRTQLATLVEQKSSEQRELVGETAQRVQVAAQSASRDIAACQQALCSQLGRLHGEQQGEMQRISQENRETLSAANREFSDGLQALRAQLGQLQAEQQGEVQRSSQETREVLQSARRGVVDGLEALGARIEGLQAEQRGESQRSAQETRAALAEANREVGAGLEALSAQLERLQGQQREQAQRNSQEARETVHAANRELSAGLEALGAQLERLQGEQREEAQRLAMETTAAARHEIAGGIQLLEAKLARREGEQQDLLLENSLTVQQAADAMKRELLARFEQVGGRIENAMESRSSALANDMLEVAALFDTISAEVRACLAESLQQPPQARTQPVAALMALDVVEPSVSQATEASAQPLVEPCSQPRLEYDRDEGHNEAGEQRDLDDESSRFDPL